MSLSVNSAWMSRRCGLDTECVCIGRPSLFRTAMSGGLNAGRRRRGKADAEPRLRARRRGLESEGANPCSMRAPAHGWHHERPSWRVRHLREGDGCRQIIDRVVRPRMIKLIGGGVAFGDRPRPRHRGREAPLSKRNAGYQAGKMMFAWQPPSGRSSQAALPPSCPAKTDTSRVPRPATSSFAPPFPLSVTVNRS